MSNGGIMITGPVAISYVRLCVIASGLRMEKSCPNMALTRGIKASYAAKDDLAAAGGTWKGKPITRRSKIPIDYLIDWYDQHKDNYVTEHQQTITDNIKSF